MSKSLHYFMRESAKEEPIIRVSGIESLIDEKGDVLSFEIKQLSRRTIQEIFDKYESREIVYDENKRPYVVDGEVVCRTNTDSARAVRHLIVEALKYPNLKDSELMEFFNCYDVTDMPLHVFSKGGEYNRLVEIVMGVLGMGGSSREQVREVDEAKN